MWIAGRWIKQEKTILCKYCNISITTTNSKIQFCSSKCRSNHNGKVHHERHKGSRDYYLKRLCTSEIRSNLTYDGLEKLFQAQEGLCSLSGIPMTWTMDGGKSRTNISIDRLVPGGEYTMENIRLVCSIVNTMRSNMSDDELLTWCKAIVSK